MELIQYKKLQKYHLGVPVLPAEYKKGNINIIDDFEDLSDCETPDLTGEYWIYPLNTNKLYDSNTGFTFTRHHFDSEYDYYLISGEGTSLSFTSTDVMQGNLLNVTNITSMNSMFSGCSSLTSLNTTQWDTSKVTSLSYMFSGCSSLTEIIGIQEWNTGKVTNLSYMFSGCTSLTSLDLTNWFRPSSSTVKSLNYMFSGCNNLTSLNLSSWNDGETYQVRGMFNGCSSLTSLNLDEWLIGLIATTDYNVFDGCSSLQTIYLRGSNARTLNFINCQLQFSGIRNNVTIVTE